MTETTPVQTLLSISLGYGLTRCLQVVADFGVADALDDTPQTAADLASRTGAHGGALERVLRLLVAHSVFSSQGGSYSHTPASRLLRADHPQSMRSLIRMTAIPAFTSAFGVLDDAVRTGAPVLDKVVPGGLWKYFSTRPEESRVFDEAMTGKAWGQIAGVLSAYDFSTFDCIADIGGGRGHLLKAVLAKTPHASGVLFDLAQALQNAAAASDRLQLQSGDFFKDVLPTCDAYLLMDVLHDWNDEDSLKILQAIRRVAPQQAKVLVIEGVVTESPSGNANLKMLDIWMLLLGGRQRSQREFADLFTKAGFTFSREIGIGPDASILEAVAA